MIYYHYHAVRQLQKGEFKHFDGIVKMSAPVQEYDRYTELKKSIDPDGGAEGLIIQNLSVLHED